MDLFLLKDPLGDADLAESRVALRVASVPDTGSTLLLMVGGFGMLILGRKFAVA